MRLIRFNRAIPLIVVFYYGTLASCQKQNSVIATSPKGTIRAEVRNDAVLVTDEGKRVVRFVTHSTGYQVSVFNNDQLIGMIELRKGSPIPEAVTVRQQLPSGKEIMRQYNAEGQVTEVPIAAERESK